MIFSDRGAWHGYAVTADDAVDVVSFVDGRGAHLAVTSGITGVRPDDDELVLQFGDAGSGRIRFEDSRSVRIDLPGGVAMRATGEPSFRLSSEASGVYRHYFTAGPRTSADLEDVPRTLRWNWRAPLGGLKHGGAVPSPYAYNGLRTWDAWKHAAVLPTPLAREHVRAIFDHQRDDGMLPDTVARLPEENNWRNSKPPLAAWACSRHEGLLEEMREPLERYHAWWEASRRPAGTKLFAYGGTGLVESTWESGWEDATRYDDAKLVDGRQDVLSVDLNAWMCLEKRLLGKPDPELERLVDEVFFFADDGGGGAYYDVTWPGLERVPTLTAATWIPLWCGVASPAHAEAVLRRMVDPADFDTPLPFPSVARSDPRFDPAGHRRGAVWLDYAQWAVEVLRRHGREDAADRAVERLLAVAPDWERYDPLTGEPAEGSTLAMTQSSSTAAALHGLLMFD